MSRVTYFDTSALVKLVIEEPESDAMRSTLPALTRQSASELVVLEMMRTVRHKAPQAEQRARAVLERLALARLTREVLLAAAGIPPRALTSLDAIHIATAVALGAELMVSYDRELLAAAEAAGIETISPA